MLKKIFDPSHELGRNMLALKQPLLQAAGFSLVINLLYLVPTLYMLQVYDRVLTSRNLTTLAMLTLVVVFAFCMLGMLDSVRSKLLTRVGVMLHQQLHVRVFDAAFERYVKRQGGTPQAAAQDLTTVRQFVGGTGSLALFDTPWVPVYLCAITLLSPWMGLFGVVVIVFQVGLAKVNEVLTHKPIVEANKVAMESAQFLQNNLRHADAVRALGMQAAMRTRWKGLQSRLLALQNYGSEYAASIGSVSKTSRMLFQSLILGLGAILAVAGDLTPGAMIAGSVLLSRALAPIELLISGWKQSVAATEAYDRLKGLLAAEPAPGVALQLPTPCGVVDVEGITASPPGSKTVALRNVGFHLDAGDVLLVMGPSGSGKSSLARLLVGVWGGTEGTVRLDGADVYQWDKNLLGPHLGYLPQEIALFEGSVAENIARYGELDSEAVVAAAQMAGVHEMVLNLPQGYETPIGVGGAALSGGQSQRIALARALYKQPKLVVLDEPNSNLDQAGEVALQTAVTRLREAGSTVVMVAHHPGLMQVANKLLMLRDGALVVFGPKEKALAYLRDKGRKPDAPANAVPRLSNVEPTA